MASDRVEYTALDNLQGLSVSKILRLLGSFNLTMNGEYSFLPIQ